MRLPTRAPARPQPRINRELTQERARRWNGWRLLDFRDGEMLNRVSEGRKSRHQADHACDADNIDLRRRRLYVRFFFRGFSRRDHVTKRARMTTIKRLDNCLTQGRAF